MKRILQLKLKILAKLVLRKYKPKVIGITGSVGKTSTKEAVFAVLSVAYRVRKNIKNYNNEIGLPLTIIGCNSPGKSLWGWSLVFWRALRLILFRENNYPEILILEMGVDRPGDMDYLLSITKCDIGIITRIGQSHIEFFGTVDGIQTEKVKLIKHLKADGWAILNFNDERTKKISEKLKNKFITYGFGDEATIKASEVLFSFEDKHDIHNLRGLSFKMSHKGSTVPVLIPDVISETAIYSGLAGAAVGIILGINLVKIAEALRSLKLPSGRMNLINGVKNTLIVDDSYNSSPQSLMVALDVISRIKIGDGNYKYAVLGDMLELGSVSEESHREAGRYVAKAKVDKLIVVGERARDIARGAKEAALKKDNIFHFSNSEEAGKFIQERIQEGDLIFVKGSQGVRMEKVVKEIMADPLRAKELLCRQDESWIK